MHFLRKVRAIFNQSSGRDALSANILLSTSGFATKLTAISPRSGKFGHTGLAKRQNGPATSKQIQRPRVSAVGEKKDFGYLIRIKNKKSDRAPDMEGQLEISGQRFDLVGWVKLSKKGNKYLSILATPQPTNAAKEAK